MPAPQTQEKLAPEPPSPPPPTNTPWGLIPIRQEDMKIYLTSRIIDLSTGVHNTRSVHLWYWSCKQVYHVKSISRLLFLRTPYNNLKLRNQPCRKARKNFSCNQMQFMKIYLARNTRAAMHQ